MDVRYAVVDVETTGFSPREDRVVEVACVLLDTRLQIAGGFSSLVDPGRPIPQYATGVHGITTPTCAERPCSPPRARCALRPRARPSSLTTRRSIAAFWSVWPIARGSARSNSRAPHFGGACVQQTSSCAAISTSKIRA